MQVRSIRVAELQHEEEQQKRIRSFLQGRSLTPQEEESLRKVLSFNPTFLILLEEEKEMKGLVALTPAAKDPFERKVTDLPIWRLRFCAQGEIFESLQKIAYSNLSFDYLMNNCNLNSVADILKMIENSSVQVGAVIAKHDKNNLDKNSCLFVKSLGEAASYESLDSSYRELDNYNIVVI